MFWILLFLYLSVLATLSCRQHLHMSSTISIWFTCPVTRSIGWCGTWSCRRSVIHGSMMQWWLQHMPGVSITNQWDQVHLVMRSMVCWHLFSSLKWSMIVSSFENGWNSSVWTFSMASLKEERLSMRYFGSKCLSYQASRQKKDCPRVVAGLPGTSKHISNCQSGLPAGVYLSGTSKMQRSRTLIKWLQIGRRAGRRWVACS